jgi:superfamily I DNA/RNA helicase
MAFSPTKEQQVIVKAAKKLKNLRIQAYAGSGKSSTLRLIAEALPKCKGLYLTFNKSLAEEAKELFPESVQCSTVHSLAFRAVQPKIASSPKEFLVSVVEPLFKDINTTYRSSFAWATYYSLVKFCYSDCQEVDESCLYNSGTFEEMDNMVTWLDNSGDLGTEEEKAAKVREFVLEAVRMVWKVISSNNSIKVTHDMYLKQFEIGLCEGDIYCDYVCLDEAQDSSDVIISIVRKIGKPAFIVGDCWQQIYEWRGAKNALDKVDGERLTLSRSFRFGPDLANFASDLLGLKKSRIEGFGETSVSFGAPLQVDAVIARSNKAVFEAAFKAYQEGRPARMPHALALRNEFEKLSVFLSGKSERYCGFTDPADLLERIKKDPLTIDNGWMVVYTGEPKKFISALEALAKAKKGTMYSTAHKAKGMEWDNVYVDVESWVKGKGKEEDLRTLYVAVTRAKKHLFINIPIEVAVKWASDLH